MNIMIISFVPQKYEINQKLISNLYTHNKHYLVGNTKSNNIYFKIY